MSRTLEQQIATIVNLQILLIGERQRMVSIRDNPKSTMESQIHAGAWVVDIDRLMCDNNIRFSNLLSK